MKTDQYILGIQSFANQESGAAILKYAANGEILGYSAISEERLIRKKHPYTFPLHSIAYCMDYFGISSLDEIDLLMTDYIHLKRWFHSGLSYRAGEFDYLKLTFNISPEKIRTIRHHEAHAAAAYYTSGFKDAAILIVDGIGSLLETTTYYCGRGSKISFLENYSYRGIGGVYSAVSKNILNMGTGGEGKTMGLAPYGARHKPVLRIHGKLNGIINDYSDFMRRRPYSDILSYTDTKRRIDPIKVPHKVCLDSKDAVKPYFSRIAFEVQAEAERALVHLARDLYSKTRSRNLCIAGGVGLNSVSNKIILDKSGFEDIFIFPACSDAGIPLGLVLAGYYSHALPKRTQKSTIHFSHAYTGITYPRKHALRVLKKYHLPHTRTTTENVAALIADGNIVGWFQGGSEYGPRALGHRSILADSRKAEMKDIVNKRIKHRESYRPFAPAILLERASEYFDLNGRSSPFMLLVADVKKPDSIPSVTHIDNTARVQTVTKKDNGAYYDLIDVFGKLTGVPCILNTSFNDAGEPIVETPLDALICFLKTKMDYLVLGDILVDARHIRGKKKIVAQMHRDRGACLQKRHRELIRRFCPLYDAALRDHFLNEMNTMALWHTQYRAKYELEKKVLEWHRGKKKILIIGTPDHTATLLEKITYFNLLKIVGFHHFEKKHDVKKHGRSFDLPYVPVSHGALPNVVYDEIIISSYEYQPEIEQYLVKKAISKPVYSIYDTMGRNLMETLEKFPSYSIAQ